MKKKTPLKEKLKSRKFIASSLIALFIIFSVVSALICYFFFPDAEQPLWEILYYTTQIISSICVTGGVIIAVWQYYLSSNNMRKQFKMERVQRAIDLSEYYKNNILNNLTALRYIFNESGVNDILNSIDVKKFHHFDYYELQNIFTPTQINKLKDIQQSEDFIKALLHANEIFDLNLNIRITVKQSKNQGVSTVSNSSIAVEFASNLINKTLNDREYFALHFKHQTADESVIYQSLHQTYLRTMPYLYYFIANGNQDPANKFYTNTIWLYNQWVSEKENQEKNRSKNSENVQRPGTIIDVNS